MAWLYNLVFSALLLFFGLLVALLYAFILGVAKSEGSPFPGRSFPDAPLGAGLAMERLTREQGIMLASMRTGPGLRPLIGLTNELLRWLGTFSLPLSCGCTRLLLMPS